MRRSKWAPRSLGRRGPTTRRWIRRQPLTAPASIPELQIAEPVVQPVRATLPELNRGRRDAVSAPTRRARDRLATVALTHLAHAPLKKLARSDSATLPRSDRGETAAARSAHEVVVRFLRRDAAHGALDADLSVELGPDEDERGTSVRRQLPALTAVVVGEEQETALVDPAQEHRAGRGPPARGGRCDRHGIRPGAACRARVGQPRQELPDRIFAGGLFVQRARP